MKATCTAFTSFMKSHPLWRVVAVTLLVAAVMWLVPLRPTTLYLRFDVPHVADETPTHIEVDSSAGYSGRYTVETAVAQGKVGVKIERNFLPVERVCVTNEAVASAVTRMEVRQSIFELSDHCCVSIDGAVLAKDATGFYVLTEESLKAVAEGAASSTMQRMFLSGVALVCGIIAAVFVLVKRRFGTIKALTISGMLAGCTVFLVLSRQYLGRGIPVAWFHVPVWVPVAAVMIAVFSLLVSCLLITKKGVAAKRLIVVIYVAALLFSAAKMVFYSERVGRTPDELAHVGYIAQLQQSGDIIPHYEELRVPEAVAKTGHLWLVRLNEDTTNYLGHPPLYYQVMRLAGGISFQEDNLFTVNIWRLRLLSVCMTLIGLGLAFYIGYSRIKARPLVHMLYATVCVSVPMFAYGSSGVNNDALTFVTIPLFFLGILRYLEHRRNAATYLLIAVGICATVLTKLTAGIIVAVAALIVLLVTLVREKNVRELLKPAFLLTLLIYAVPVAYYLLVYARYGNFRPGVFSLDPAYAYNSGFYIEPTERGSASLVAYIVYFFDNFMRSWVGIFSHVSLQKSTAHWFSVQYIALVALWFSPMLFAKRTLRNKSSYSLGLIACYVGIAITLVMQFLNGYRGYMSRGYMGGFQSRYYLCVVFVLAFGMALALRYLFKNLKGDAQHTRWMRHVLEGITAVYIGILFYEDLLYFLLHFEQYLIG